MGAETWAVGDRRGSAGSVASAQETSRPAQPPSAFTLFRDKLKHPSAQPVLLKLRDFAAAFPQRVSRTEAARRVHGFLASTQQFVLSECMVFSADADDESRTNTAEGLEKFVLSRMYQRLFAAEPSDAAEDAKLQRQIASLQWVDFKNLGVPPIEPSFIDLAVNELEKIDTFKAPRDKIVCILNACRVINDVLKHTMEEQGAKTRPLSADDFLPLLIYACIRANPVRLHSNLEYVVSFRHPSRLVGEDAYYVTTLRSAVVFILQVTPKELDVSPEEFESQCSDCLADFQREEAAASAFRQEAAAEAGIETGFGRAMPSTEPMTAVEKGATLPEDTKRILESHFYKLLVRHELVTCGRSSGRELRLGDVPVILEDYKQLAGLLRSLDGRGGERTRSGAISENIPSGDV